MEGEAPVEGASEESDAASLAVEDEIEAFFNEIDEMKNLVAGKQEAHARDREVAEELTDQLKEARLEITRLKEEKEALENQTSGTKLGAEQEKEYLLKIENLQERVKDLTAEYLQAEEAWAKERFLYEETLSDFEVGGDEADTVLAQKLRDARLEQRTLQKKLDSSHAAFKALERRYEAKQTSAQIQDWQEDAKGLEQDIEEASSSLFKGEETSEAKVQKCV